MADERVSRVERLWIWGFAVFIVLFTGLPYIAAALRAPETFSGFLIGVEDGNSYIAKMLAGANGAWLFRSPYTAQPQAGAFLYVPYLLLGKLLGPNANHGHLVLLFHVFRTLSLVALCFATYQFLAHFVEKIALRKLGLVLATLGSGLGWLLVILGKPASLNSLALDFYSPETFGFLANLIIPHLVLARALLLWGLLGYLKSETGWRVWLLWLAMALSHPITAAIGLLLMALHFAVQWFADPARRKSSGQTYAWAAGGAAVPLAAFGWSYLFDAYIRSWDTQNTILSPAPMAYVLAYGWLLPFVFLGLRHLVAAKPQAARLLVVWLVLLPVLIYAPLGVQRRLVEGAWVMLLAAGLAAFDLRPPRVPRALLWIFCLAFPSTLFLWLGLWPIALRPAPSIALSQDYVAAFSQLRQRSHPGEVVLSSFATGNALPAWAPLRVVLGHWSETPEAQYASESVQAFYATGGVEANLLGDQLADYVIWGPNEKALGSDGPSETDHFELVVEAGEVRIYRVVNENN